MWYRITDRPLPNLHDGDRIKLMLEFSQYFGHFAPDGKHKVWAIWDGLNEEFFEVESGQYIFDEDIVEWCEDNKND